MAVAGSVTNTVLVEMTPSGKVVVVRREQAHGLACFGGSCNEILGRLLVGRPVRLTEQKFNEFRKWEEEVTE